MKTLEFRIRKLHVTSETEKKLQKRQPSRVYVSEEALIELTGSKDGGRAVSIEKAGGPVAVESAQQLHPAAAASSSLASSAALLSSPPQRHEATLWKAPEKLDKGVTQMYDAFRDACGYRLGEHVRITALGRTLPDADEVVLEEIPAAPTTSGPGATAGTAHKLGDTGQEGSVAGVGQEPIPPRDLSGWECFLAGRLAHVEHVYAGFVLKNLYLRGPERSFVVKSVNGLATGNARYLDRKTSVTIAKPSIFTSEGASGVSPRELKVTGVRGLDAQVAKLNDLFRVVTATPQSRVKASIPGVVIHGGHGTGKTLLLDKIANTGWGTVFRIQFKDKLAEIQEAFQKARLHQPSLVLIDQLERLIDKDRNNRGAVILALCEALDTLKSDAEAQEEPLKVVVIATCLDYTADVPEDLKDPGRFTSEIYLPLPDVDGRKEILASMDLCVDPGEEPSLLRRLSERTHAYNGKDLRRLVDEARLIGTIRLDKEKTHRTRPSSGVEACDDTIRPDAETETTSPAYYVTEDYEEALKNVRPSAMHDINLKPPPIRWDDIGGQDTVKMCLRRAVRLSTEPIEVLRRFFEHPPKGFLLYGPPGCSKTMAAQAMATESGLNFFAVKGAELLNMYVGESERAVRRLFQRAREVAPSMIFFDEIDAIAGQRHGFGHKGSSPTSGGGSSSSSSSSSSNSSVNVLTTLLNEMDGFEALQGVVVLAATNRPQALDPALLRPGRFDELIYVSPPDEEARRAIFRGVAAKRRMHADVDVDRLARETDGCSGAEIKGICAVAGIAAYDRYITGKATREGDDDGGGGEAVIMMRDLEQAIRSQKRQITREMLQGFEEWERQFRRY
jgi:AAA family ATPase